MVWLAASLFLAALLTPYLYDAGKSFAVSAESHDYPAVLESIAKSAKKAEVDRYFSRCLLVSALALLPLLIRRVRSIPESENRAEYKLKKLSWRNRIFQLCSGVLMGAAVLGLLAVVLHLTGASHPKGDAISLSKLLSKALLPALGAGIIEELVFRGLLLGLWLRACSLWSAWLGSSLMFSFVHFLKPPEGVEIANPYAWHSGLEILSSTLGHFTNPQFFVTEFATLTLLGLMLAYCRTRTFSLWLPIGIHAGLVFALKTFSMTQQLNPESPLNPWFIGVDLKSGIFPLLALGVCSICSLLFVKRFSHVAQ